MSRSPDDIEVSWAKVGMLALVPVALVLIVTLVLAVQTVPAGHTGVEKGWAGDTTGQTFEPGTHFIVPWHSVQKVECRPRTYTMADMQGEGKKSQKQDAVVVDSVNGTVHRVDVTIRYTVNCEQAVEFVDRWDSESQLEHRLIRPDARSDIRDRGAAIESDTIYKQPGREALSETASQTINSNFEDEPVQLQAVKIREVTIPKGLRTALSEKEQAKVDIEKKEHEVKQEQKEAERKRIEARADANVTRIRGEALANNPIVLKQQYIDALRNGETVYVVPDDGSTPVFLQAEGNATAGGG